MGGDEFVILLTDTGREGAGAAVRSFETALEEHSHTAGTPISVSMGVVAFRTAPSSVDEMLRAADELMYSAKSGGGGARFRDIGGAVASLRPA
jgi:diguanylate cyclase (GGDEF)-like protein